MGSSRFKVIVRVVGHITLAWVIYKAIGFAGALRAIASRCPFGQSTLSVR
ncbi:hypothetical protein [Allocoleopsis sp.]